MLTKLSFDIKLHKLMLLWVKVISYGLIRWANVIKYGLEWSDKI